MVEELQALMDKMKAGEADAQGFQIAWLSFELRRTSALEARVAEEVKHMAMVQAQAKRQSVALESIAVTLAGLADKAAHLERQILTKC